VKEYEEVLEAGVDSQLVAVITGAENERGGRKERMIISTTYIRAKAQQLAT
jgi:hypothetical protein